MARKLHSGDSIYFCARLWKDLSVLPEGNSLGLLSTVSFCTKCNWFHFLMPLIDNPIDAPKKKFISTKSMLTIKSKKKDPLD